MAARLFLCVVLVGSICLVACQQSAQETGQAVASPVEEALPGSPESDPRAVELAQRSIELMGGKENLAKLRFVSWHFMFHNRWHHWDRQTGNVRIEGSFSDVPYYLILMNLHTKQGRVWQRGGQEVTDPETKKAALAKGFSAWTMDSYWLFMPFKLLDPGVKLRYLGEREMVNGRMADLLEMTFAEGVGETPQNRYDVYIDQESGLVGEWAMYKKVSFERPTFRMPWGSWKEFGDVLLPTGHGQGRDWPVAVYDDLPASVFTSPDPVPR